MSGVKVFVGSLPPGSTEATLAEHFSPYGEILQYIVKTEQRYGFVFFASMEEAQQAISLLNGAPVGGSTLVVKLADKQQPGSVAAGVVPMPPQAAYAGGKGGMMAPGGDRVYVKGLPSGMTDEAVREIFGPYGNVIDTKVLVSDGVANDGTGQSVAIIRMATEPEARWLVDNLNGNMPQGLARPIEVSFAGSRRQQQQQQQLQQQVVQQQVQYQPAVPAPPPQRAAPYPPPQPPPVHTADGGVKAAAGVPGIKPTVPSVTMLKTQVPPACKLYIKGLPWGADNEYLYSVFSPWARLLEATALAKNGYTIGFITCLTEVEAQECIQNVNGVPLTDGSVLQVSVKTMK